MKIVHFNKGPSYLINAMPDVESIVSEYKPHILGLSESNFKKSHDENDVQIENYKPHFSKTLENPILNASRVAVYVHNDIVAKQRSDLESDLFSSIWLELGLKRNKKIVFYIIYNPATFLSNNTIYEFVYI